MLIAGELGPSTSVDILEDPFESEDLKKGGGALARRALSVTKLFALLL
jgi:hypothetical protein